MSGSRVSGLRFYLQLRLQTVPVVVASGVVVRVVLASGVVVLDEEASGVVVLVLVESGVVVLVEDGPGPPAVGAG